MIVGHGVDPFCRIIVSPVFRLLISESDNSSAMFAYDLGIAGKNIKQASRVRMIWEGGGFTINRHGGLLEGLWIRIAGRLMFAYIIVQRYGKNQ